LEFAATIFVLVGLMIWPVWTAFVFMPGTFNNDQHPSIWWIAVVLVWAIAGPVLLFKTVLPKLKKRWES
tara:strand:- start:6397 stop:6603 length:207 start_codon:yes stop_codon:yes gene_type:complete